MLGVMRRAMLAPLSYLADLRTLTWKRYLLLGTNFSPSYPLSALYALLATLGFSAYVAFLVFTAPEGNNCFANVRPGAYVLAVLYPIETVLFFICLTGSVALSKSACWKTTILLVLGPLLSGFGFGELAFVEMCLLSTEEKNSFGMLSLFKNEAFIDSMVYLYIALLMLYFLLLPCSQFLYRRQKQQEKQRALRKKEQDRHQKKSDEKTRNSQQNRNSKSGRQSKVLDSKEKKAEAGDEPGLGHQEEQVDAEEEGVCCSRCICILYYMFVLVFSLSFCLIVVVKVVGPVLFTYIWLNMADNIADYQQSQQRIYLGLSLNAYFGPIAITFLTLLLQRIVRLCRKKQNLHPDELEPKTVELEGTQPEAPTAEEQDATAEVAVKRGNAPSMRDSLL